MVLYSDRYIIFLLLYKYGFTSNTWCFLYPDNLRGPMFNINGIECQINIHSSVYLSTTGIYYSYTQSDNHYYVYTGTLSAKMLDFIANYISQPYEICSFLGKKTSTNIINTTISSNITITTLYSSRETNNNNTYHTYYTADNSSNHTLKVYLSHWNFGVAMISSTGIILYNNTKSKYINSDVRNDIEKYLKIGYNLDYFGFDYTVYQQSKSTDNFNTTSARGKISINDNGSLFIYKTNARYDGYNGLNVSSFSYFINSTIPHSSKNYSWYANINM